MGQDGSQLFAARVASQRLSVSPVLENVVACGIVAGDRLLLVPHVSYGPEASVVAWPSLRRIAAVTPQPVPGRDQLAHRAADVGVQVVPDQDERACQLLVRGVQEPGVVRLGEPLALICPGGRGACGRSAAAGSRAGRRSARPATPACHGRRSPSRRGYGRGGPRCVPSAASGPGRTRLRSRARRPGPPPCFYDRPGVLPPPGDLLLVPLRRPPGRDLHGPADPVQQHVHPGQRVLHPEPPPDLVARPGPASSTDPHSPQAAGPASSTASSSATCAAVSLHFAPPAPFEASASRPPAASARRHRFTDIRDTRNRLGDLPVAGPGLDHLRGRQPHLLPAGPLRRVQAAAIGIPHASGIAHQAPDDQTR